MDKNKVIETINELPQEFELDVLLEKLLFIEKVDKGLEQARLGQTISHEQVKKMVDGWRK